MAQRGVLLDQDQLCCSVCLDLLKEPVTIPCGHSYCMSCIEGCWDQDVLKEVYSCPQCRETFTPRPTLRETKMLAELVEKLKTAAERTEEQRSAQAAVEDSDQIFTELIRSIERRSSEVKELIRAQEKAQVSQAEGLLEQLKQEIAELRRRRTELEQLSRTEDHIHFLQTVSALRGKLEDFLKGEWTKISTTVDVVLPPEPKTREQFLQHSCQLTLDPNTAGRLLSLSEGNRKVTCTEQDQRYPDHLDRFTYYCQVLCRECLPVRCYWEVEWTGEWVYTAVSYKDISRTETYGGFGDNNKSWSLKCSRGDNWFRHNNVETKVSGTQSSRVGVYLDHKAGTLSFYSVSHKMTLLHRVQTTFTQPLYPGFCLNGTAELVKL